MQRLELHLPMYLEELMVYRGEMSLEVDTQPHLLLVSIGSLVLREYVFEMRIIIVETIQLF